MALVTVVTQRADLILGLQLLTMCWPDLFLITRANKTETMGFGKPTRLITSAEWQECVMSIPGHVFASQDRSSDTMST